MNPPSPTLPTTPGTYLFVGTRETPHLHNLLRTPLPEIVRVTEKNGALTYIGNDFFYHPEKTVGLWVDLTEDAQALRAQAHQVLVENATHLIVRTLKEYSRTKNGVVDSVINFSHDKDKAREVVELAFDHAVDKGLIVATNYGCWTVAP